MEYKKKLTQEDVEKILSEGVKNMPQNPAAQGYKQEQIRGFFYIPEEKILLKIMEVEDGIAEVLKDIVSKGEGVPTTNETNAVLYQDTLTGLVYQWIDNAWVKLIKETDYPTGSVSGVVKVDAYFGIKLRDGNKLELNAATESEIKDKTQSRKALVPSTLDLVVKTGLTTNTITLTDEEKAAALVWLGMILDSGSSTNANDIVKRFSGGNIFVPSVPTYNGAATSKYYVVNLPDYLTAEEKAKWERWLGGSGGSGGSQLYLHQVPIHFTGFVDVDIPEFTLILNVLSSQSTAYGSETSIETLVNDTFNKIVSLSFVSTEVRFLDAIVSSFIVKNDAWTLKYLQSVTQTEYTLSGPVDYEGHKLEIMTYTPTPL